MKIKIQMIQTHVDWRYLQYHVLQQHVVWGYSQAQVLQSVFQILIWKCLSLFSVSLNVDTRLQWMRNIFCFGHKCGADNSLYIYIYIYIYICVCVCVCVIWVFYKFTYIISRFLSLDSFWNTYLYQIFGLTMEWLQIGWFIFHACIVRMFYMFIDLHYTISTCYSFLVLPM